MAEIVSVTGSTTIALGDGWKLASTRAGACATPQDLPGDLTWIPARVPGTVAAALQKAGLWSLSDPTPLHDRDHWLRTRFAGQGRETLRFAGLATIAEVWLNGVKILSSDNMFLSHAVAVDLAGDNELAICFRALDEELAKPAPAGRWRPRMITPSTLRAIRTTVLGHMPGWCPPVHAVGPWRPVERVRTGDLVAREADVRVSLDGSAGKLDVRLTLSAPPSGPGVLTCAGHSASLMQVQDMTYAASLTIPDVAPWWPHTHGSPNLHQVVVTFGTDHIDLGRTGFRRIEVDRGADGQGFGVRINGEAVFCRGAVWAAADIVSQSGDRAAVETWLKLAHEAGMNMVRVPGTTVYPSRTFYEVCDELGLLVWQDFMFANFDYPAGDAEFADSVRLEVAQFLGATQTSPSLAVLCGGSEVYQQAAMLGLPARKYLNPIFEETLPAEIAKRRPDVPYVAGSPSGGPLPFVVDAGVGHYFGVGAYLRPLTDARHAGVRFASECLAYANVPEASTLERELAAVPAVHDPRWKARVPRDSGATWDFEDVREHYLEQMFGVSARRLRYEDADRYLMLSRAVTAELMQQVFAEWQRKGSPTRGALVLMLQDLWPGAGWGVIDSTAEPKSPWFALKRSFTPLRVSVTDEGVNGLAIHVANETATPRSVVLELTALRHGRTPVLKAKREISLPARSNETMSAYDLIGSFFDISYAYRFQPPQHDATVVRLLDAATRACLSETMHFPLGHAGPYDTADITAVPECDEHGWSLRLTAGRVARFVHIADAGLRPEDNWFHLSPLAEKHVRLNPRGDHDGTPRPHGEIRAINLSTPVKYRVAP